MQKNKQNLAIQLTHYWGELVATDKNALVDFYHERGLLIPTFSDNFDMGRVEIRKYFSKLSSENPDLSVEFLNIIPQIGDNWIMTSGSYIFHGVEKTLARFSFLFGYCPFAKEWKIINHHSSVMP